MGLDLNYVLTGTAIGSAVVGVHYLGLKLRDWYVRRRKVYEMPPIPAELKYTYVSGGCSRHGNFTAPFLPHEVRGCPMCLHEKQQEPTVENVDARDAARYRWLRDHCKDGDIREGLGWIGQDVGIDAAIDAEIARGKDANRTPAVS